MKIQHKFIMILVVAIPAVGKASERGNELNSYADQTIVMQMPLSNNIARLSRPPDSALLKQAEQDYQAGRFAQAIERFGIVAAMNNHPFSWLRIGNIWHRRGQVAMAIDAYARARTSAAISPKHQGLWRRAMINMTLLGLDQAKQSIHAIGPDRQSQIGVSWAKEIRLRLSEIQQALPPLNSVAGASVTVTNDPPAIVKRARKRRAK